MNFLPPFTSKQRNFDKESLQSNQEEWEGEGGVSSSTGGGSEGGLFVLIDSNGYLSYI